MDNLKEIIANHNDGILTLSMNRPEKRNAMTTVMLAELIYCLEQAAVDATVRVIVIRGEGPGFCPGDDLAGMGALPADFHYEVQHPVSHPGLQTCLRACPKPVIAVLHGYVFGVGLDVAMACDFRIATDSVQIRDQRVIERGMHAVTGCAWFQPRAIGTARAMEFLMLGKPYNGTEAAAAGMVTQAVAESELENAVSNMAQTLARGPTKAIALMKEQIYRGQDMTLDEFHNYAAPLIRDVEIKDRQEGINAFLEKRPANFTGE